MIEFLKKIFKGKELEDKIDSVKDKSVQIYCQACGKDITLEGGDVSSSGRIYCHGYKDNEARCLDNEMTLMAQGKIPPAVMIFNYHTPQEVKDDIKRGKLKEYGLLEQAASIN